MRVRESVTIEGQLVLTFAVGEEDEDRIEIDGFDLFDLISAQFSDVNDRRTRQTLPGKYRVVVERVG